MLWTTGPWNAAFLSDIMLRTYARQINNWRHTLTSLLSSRKAYLHATSVRRQLQAAFLNRKFLDSHSLKWHYKPSSRCKLRLHSISYLINALSRAKFAKNDYEKVNFVAVCFLLFLLGRKIKKKIYPFFSVITKDISPHELKISAISLVRIIREMTDIFYTFDEI